MEIPQSSSTLTVSETACKKVIFMAGAGHSGSTLLGMMLGSGTGILFAGEVVNYIFLNDMSWGLHKRSCRVCGINCPIWSNFVPDNNLYEILSERSKCPIILDSSKKPTAWAQTQSTRVGDFGAERCLIFIVRDPRAVVASNLRKDTKNISAREYAEMWAMQMQDSENLASNFPGPVVTLRYEDLATKPEETLRIVCQGIGIPFEFAMLHPWEKKHHPLRGNAGTQSLATGNFNILKLLHIREHYASHPRTIILDERWKQELNKTTLDDIKIGGGEMYSKYILETPFTS